MKTALILLSLLGMVCAFSMKNLHRRAKVEDSEENGVFKYRPRYYLYKHAYFYPPLKRFPVQSNSDSSEENGNGDSSEEEEEEEETSNEEGNNEENENSDENEESEAENTTLSTATPGYGDENTPVTGDIGLGAIQFPKKAAKKEESDEEEEEEENEENEVEVDENEQDINGTSTNSTEVDNGNGSSGGDNEEGETEDNAEGTTTVNRQDNGGSETTTSPNDGFESTTPPQEIYGITTLPYRKTTLAYEEYEPTGNDEFENGYEVYDSEKGGPRGDNYRVYEDEYSYKGYGYDNHNYYYNH
ncbi:integrin-binding sialoprotein [Tamandua tetradactyla]|uniref:integrin-binding sialoprotein n=1 Tax=Tamandua tetradactyla TaxID=48850 RepID=UPI00405471D6